MRKFHKVKQEFIKYENEDIILPKRATKFSAGYDFCSPTDCVIEPNKSLLIWTNVKAEFNENEVLFLFVRSSMGKKHIVLANGTGVIESDYFSNESNDGNIGFRLLNLGDEPYIIKVGDKIGQGVFTSFLTVDDEEENLQKRRGGFGSTDK